jgi:hypothetical protein
MRQILLHNLIACLIGLLYLGFADRSEIYYFALVSVIICVVATILLVLTKVEN